MKRAVVGPLGVLAGLLWAGAAAAQAPEGVRYEIANTGSVRTGMAPARARRADALPLDAVPPGWREKVIKVAQQPTLSAHGAAEEFVASVYDWLLDHPDRAAVAWRRLGVPCVDIQPIGQGQFRWSDGEGSELVWSTVWRGDADRIWYGEGHARPSPLLPMVPVRVVAILHHAVAVAQPRVVQ